jgi:16S rRNA processing protein RimM
LNKQELLFIGRISKISKKKLVVFLELAQNVFWKPEKNKQIYLGEAAYLVENFGLCNYGFSIKLKGVDDLDALFGLVGAEVFAPADEFYVTSYSREALIGCEVLSTKGELLGRVTDIYKTPPGSILEVTLGSKNSLIPFKKEFVRELDEKSKKIVVELIEGMI